MKNLELKVLIQYGILGEDRIIDFATATLHIQRLTLSMPDTGTWLLGKIIYTKGDIKYTVVNSLMYKHLNHK